MVMVNRIDKLTIQIVNSRPTSYLIDYLKPKTYNLQPQDGNGVVYWFRMWDKETLRTNNKTNK